MIEALEYIVKTNQDLLVDGLGFWVIIRTGLVGREGFRGTDWGITVNDFGIFGRKVLGFGSSLSTCLSSFSNMLSIGSTSGSKLMSVLGLVIVEVFDMVRPFLGFSTELPV